MAGIKKIAHINILIIILLAFASCNVQKPIGVSLFESKVDTLVIEPKINDTLNSSELVDSVIQPVSYYQTKSEAEISPLERLEIKLDSMLITQKSIANKSDSINNLLLQYFLNQTHPVAKRDTIVIENEIILSDNRKADDKMLAESNYTTSNESRLFTDSIRILLSELRDMKKELSSYSEQRSSDTKTILVPSIINPSNDNEEKSSYKDFIILKEKSDSIMLLKEENLKLKSELALRIELSEKELAKGTHETVNESVDSLSSVINKDSVPQEPPNPLLLTSDLNKPGKTMADSIGTDNKIAIVKPVLTATKNDGKNGVNENAISKENTDTIPNQNVQSKTFEIGNHRDTISSIRDTLLIAYYNPSETTSYNEKDVLFVLNVLISSNKINTIFLSGYTDSSGAPDFNIALSKERVDFIRNKLVEIGIPQDVIFMQYFGSTYASEKIDEKDRRVEILINYTRH